MPSHSGLFFNRLRDYLAWLFLANLFVMSILLFGIKMTVDHDCQDIYTRQFKALGYWLIFEAGSTRPDCPQP